MPVMPRPDETRRRTLPSTGPASDLNADDIPDDPRSAHRHRDSLGALHAHWLEIVYDDGKPVIDEPNQTIGTRAREKSTDATPPGWDEDAGVWDAHGWVYRSHSRPALRHHADARPSTAPPPRRTGEPPHTECVRIRRPRGHAQPREHLPLRRPGVDININDHPGPEEAASRHWTRHTPRAQISRGPEDLAR